MRVYLYRAALYCEECGDRIKAGLSRPAHADPADESTYDSDEYPKGPYDNGGGEADTPQHCDSCGVFLANPLTDDGDSYVRAACEAYEYPDADGDVAPWATVAERCEEAGAVTVAEWVRHYLAPGL